EATGEGVAHVGLVERLHELDAHLARTARQRQEHAADAFHLEPRLGELLEAELVSPDANGGFDVVDQHADVADAVQHDSCRTGLARMASTARSRSLRAVPNHGVTLVARCTLLASVVTPCRARSAEAPIGLRRRDYGFSGATASSAKSLGAGSPPASVRWQ